MVILFVWDVWKNMMEMGRGGACVPARVALQGRIRRSIPRAQCVIHKHIFGMETPLCGRSGGHTGTAPTVSFGWIARCISAPSVLFGGVGVYYFNNTGSIAFLLSNSNVGWEVISSVARRALHICKWLRSILRAWGWNGFRAGRRPPSLCAPRISRLLFGSR